MSDLLRDRGSRRIRLLVTAFGAFPGAATNPTGAIARECLRRHGRRLSLLGIDLHLRMLPVRYGAIDAALAGFRAEIAPDVVLHLGLAGKRKTLCVETRACNRLTLLRGDASRALAGSRQVVAGAPGFLKARWASMRIATAMNRCASTRLSIDAGDYVCNQTLFLTLWRSPVPAGFIHVPRPRGRGGQGDIRPTLSMMAEAVADAARVMAKDLRTGLTATRTTAMVHNTESGRIDP